MKMVKARRWVPGLIACLACGATNIGPTVQTDREEAVATPDEPGAEPLPLLAAHPSQPAIAPLGCHEQTLEGAIGEHVDGLDFEVSFAAGRNRFHQGEVVQLALSFASSEANTHRLDAGTYDRAGRLHADRYALEPSEGVVDPLADYFDRGRMGMGGLRQMPMLETTPTVIERDLNEYLQVRRPGTYALRVDTTRVSMDGKQIVCGSRVLQLEVLPLDEVASSDTLRDVLRVLDGEGTEDEKSAAARRLRFLPTEDAARAMVRLLAGQNEGAGDLSFGLIGSPHRSVIIEAMSAALTEPDVGVSTRFFDTLRRLSAHQERPGYLPPWPDDLAMQARWRSSESAYVEHRSLITDRLATLLLASLPEKRGSASDVTFATLLETAFQSAESPSWMPALRPQIGRRLLTMDAQAQSRFLSDRWRQVADMSLVPALTAMADAPETDEGSRALALARLVELAPDRATPRIHAEIQRVPLRFVYFRARQAFVLPAGAISALDESLAAGIERADHEQDIRAHLLARYGSPTILPRVRAALARNPERGSSAYQGAMLSYLLRVDGVRAVRDLAIRAQGLSTDLERGVFAAALASAAEYAWHAALETQLRAILAIEGVGEAGSNAVVIAARTLGRYGSAASEEPLWVRLEAHHQRYHGREEAQSGEPWQIEDALVTALARGRGWHLDHTRLLRLRRVLLSETAGAALGQLRSEQPFTLTVFLGMNGDIRASVGRYQFDSHTRPLRPLRAGVDRHFALSGSTVPPARGTRRVHAPAVDGLLRKLAQLPPNSEVRVAVLPATHEGRTLQRSLVRWIDSHGMRGTAGPN